MEYLIGTAEDPNNWGTPGLTRGGVWAALERIVAPAYRSPFIFVQQLISEEGVVISMYLHERAGTMLLVDEAGQIYEWLGNDLGFIIISMQEARTRLVEALLDAVNDEMAQGIPAHALTIDYYRPVQKKISLIPGKR